MRRLITVTCIYSDCLGKVGENLFRRTFWSDLKKINKLLYEEGLHSGPHFADSPFEESDTYFLLLNFSTWYGVKLNSILRVNLKDMSTPSFKNFCTSEIVTLEVEKYKVFRTLGGIQNPKKMFSKMT